MKNCSRNAPSYVLFGKEAICLHNTSLQHLLNAKNVSYNVRLFTKREDFEKEKEKWNACVEIDYHEYLRIKSHSVKQPNFLKKIKEKFLLGVFD